MSVVRCGQESCTGWRFVLLFTLSSSISVLLWLFVAHGIIITAGGQWSVTLWRAVSTSPRCFSSHTSPSVILPWCLITSVVLSKHYLLPPTAASSPTQSHLLLLLLSHQHHPRCVYILPAAAPHVGPPLAPSFPPSSTFPPVASPRLSSSRCSSPIMKPYSLLLLPGFSLCYIFSSMTICSSLFSSS